MVAKFFVLISLALLLSMEMVASKRDSCGNVSQTDTSLTAIFTKIYMYTLAAYKPWTGIFNVSFPVSLVADKAHNVTYDNALNFNLTDDQATKVADRVANSVRKTFSVQTPCFLGNFVGLAVAFDLKDAGFLAKDNVVDLALNFANQTRDAFESGTCETNFDCLTKGFFDFLTSTGTLPKISYDHLTSNTVKAFMHVYDAFTRHQHGRHHH